MSDSISIVIADDHPVFRKGLKDIVEAENGMEVVGEGGDGEAAIALVREYEPDILILDLDMPKLNGLDTMKRIVDEDIRVSVIILTMYDDEDLFNRAMDLGVTGYIIKESAADDIVRGISKVARGEYFVSPGLSNHVLKKNHTLKGSREERIGLVKLTPAERRILRLIAQDNTSAQIAEKLRISPKTVEQHRSNISRKLDISGHYALLRFALQNRENL